MMPGEHEEGFVSTHCTDSDNLGTERAAQQVQHDALSQQERSKALTKMKRSFLSLCVWIHISVGDCFTPQPALNGSPAVNGSQLHTGAVNSFTPASIADTSFQLEELEDSEAGVTSIMLKFDGSVVLGPTDGPPFTGAHGTWEVEPSNDRFAMQIERTFQTGRLKSQSTDMGEFEFRVKRVYDGIFTKVGAQLAIEGSMHCIDETLGEQRVGFFKMIDITLSDSTV